MADYMIEMLSSYPTHVIWSGSELTYLEDIEREEEEGVYKSVRIGIRGGFFFAQDIMLQQPDSFGPYKETIHIQYPDDASGKPTYVKEKNFAVLNKTITIKYGEMMTSYECEWVKLDKINNNRFEEASAMLSMKVKREEILNRARVQEYRSRVRF